jgi:hypothetical protein
MILLFVQISIEQTFWISYTDLNAHKDRKDEFQKNNKNEATRCR